MKSRRVFTPSNLYFLASTKLIASSERRPLRQPSENLGWRKIMKKHITIGVAALAFGVALASVPASAQTHYGKALNDGGLVDDYNSNGTPAKPLYNSATPAAPATPHYGKALNDGGITDEPTAAQKAAAAKAQTKTVQRQTPPHYGKPLNDGGF
jgi:hypothetical protein